MCNIHLKKRPLLPVWETSFVIALVYRLALAYLFLGLSRGLFYLFNYAQFADMSAAQVLRA